MKLAIDFEVKNTGKREIDWNVGKFVVVDDADRQFPCKYADGQKSATIIRAVPGAADTTVVRATLPVEVALGSLRLAFVSQLAVDTIQAPILLKGPGELEQGKEWTSLE